jgi:hypothetical protein
MLDVASVNVSTDPDDVELKLCKPDFMITEHGLPAFYDFNLCAEINDALGLEVSKSGTVPYPSLPPQQWTLKASGTLDSVNVTIVNARLTGTIELILDIDPGRIVRNSFGIPVGFDPPRISELGLRTGPGGVALAYDSLNVDVFGSLTGRFEFPLGLAVQVPFPESDAAVTLEAEARTGLFFILDAAAEGEVTATFDGLERGVNFDAVWSNGTFAPAISSISSGPPGPPEIKWEGRQRLKAELGWLTEAGVELKVGDFSIGSASMEHLIGVYAEAVRTAPIVECTTPGPPDTSGDFAIGGTVVPGCEMDRAARVDVDVGLEATGFKFEASIGDDIFDDLNVEFATPERSCCRTHIIDLFARGDLEVTVTTELADDVDTFPSGFTDNGYDLVLSRVLPDDRQPVPSVPSHEWEPVAEIEPVVFHVDVTDPEEGEETVVMFPREEGLCKSPRSRDDNSRDDNEDCTMAAGVPHVLRLENLDPRCVVTASSVVDEDDRIEGLDGGQVGRTRFEIIKLRRFIPILPTAAQATFTVECGTDPVDEVTVTTKSAPVETILTGDWTGTFQEGETAVGDSSSAQVQILSAQPDESIEYVIVGENDLSKGEQVTGGISGATAITVGDPVVPVSWEDPDAYTVLVDNEPRGPIGLNEDKSSFLLAATKDLTVKLGSVADNCTAAPSSHVLTLNDDGTAFDENELLFLVACESIDSPTGLELVIQTSGGIDDIDPDGYIVYLDGHAQDDMVGANSETLYSPLPEHSEVGLEFQDIEFNCQIEGDNPRDVSLELQGTVSETVNFHCDPRDSFGELLITTQTSGRQLPGEYFVRAGSFEAPSPTNGSIEVVVQEGEVPVELFVPSNCTVDGENPRDVAIEGGDPPPPIEETFVVECVSDRSVDNAMGVMFFGEDGTIDRTPTTDRNNETNDEDGESSLEGGAESDDADSGGRISVSLDGAIVGFGTLVGDDWPGAVAVGERENISGTLDLDVLVRGHRGRLTANFQGTASRGRVFFTLRTEALGFDIELRFRGPVEGPLEYTGIID